MAMMHAYAEDSLDERGQMTIELCVFLPIAIIIAAIAVNAMLFFSVCSEFDRTARNAIRVYATSPEYEQMSSECAEHILATIQASIDDDNVDCEVIVTSDHQGFATYEAKVRFKPTLFGLGLRDEILGVKLPSLEHSTSLTVSPYKPGMFF